MAFGNLFFVFCFLPASLMLYYLIPGKLPMVRNFVLVLISLLFYSWGNPQYLILILFSVFYNYFAALQLSVLGEAGEKRKQKLVLILDVAVNLLLLGFFKYFAFLLSNINGIFGTELKAAALPLPIGISFYTFTVLSYIFDVYYEKCKAQTNPILCALYVTLYPKLVSGPIEAYRDMEGQLRKRSVSLAGFGAGANLFLVGLGKKVLLADNLSIPFAAISAMTDRSILTAWLGMICYSLELYFDFSGYSDMAIGLAKMFGFTFKKNFDYPYLANGVSDFWRRWHISLGAWFRNYVYIPMGGNRCSKRRQLLNLSVVWLLTGLWHGASWTFIIWGLWHGFFVITEKFLWGGAFRRLPRPIRIGLTVLEAFLGWVWFFSPSLSYALTYFGQLFGKGAAGFADASFFYYFRTNVLLLFLAVFLCGPILARLQRRYIYRSEKTAVRLVSGAAYLLLLVLCTAYLVNSTYSSFLYFQF